MEKSRFNVALVGYLAPVFLLRLQGCAYSKFEDCLSIERLSIVFGSTKFKLITIPHFAICRGTRMKIKDVIDHKIKAYLQSDIIVVILDTEEPTVAKKILNEIWSIKRNLPVHFVIDSNKDLKEEWLNSPKNITYNRVNIKDGLGFSDTLKLINTRVSEVDIPNQFILMNRPVKRRIISNDKEEEDERIAASALADLKD